MRDRRADCVDSLGALSHDNYSIPLISAKDILQDCLGCLRECDYYATVCLDSDKVQLMAQCIKLCRDCADTCDICARFMARNSDLHAQLCAICAEACDRCAAECAKHDHDHCKKCAKSCRRCAESCRQMAKATA